MLRNKHQLHPAGLVPIACSLTALALAGCGGVAVSPTDPAVASSGSTLVISQSTSSSSGSSSGTGSSGAASSSSGGSASSSGSASGTTGTGPAAALARKLGKPTRLLIGLGAQGSTDTGTAIRSQDLRPDIFEQYLVGVGSGDWTTWNQPSGYIVQIIAQAASAVGATPMYTLYQMATHGGGNLSDLNTASFMANYWANVKLLFQQIDVTGQPALVNLEPDFWGYAQQQSTTGKPSGVFAYVNNNPDCAALTNDAAGIAGCLIAMARKYAPKAYVGFPPSSWGGTTLAKVVTFMNELGAQNADFIVEQTLDRDAGCYEAQPAYCTGSSTGLYWDETNQTHPNFEDYFARLATFQTGIGHLPVVLWQTPEGVPSSTPGGTAANYRDNRVHYFLTHPEQLTALGVLAVVFGTGENHQTSVMTDGGQFQQLAAAYLAAPAPLP